LARLEGGPKWAGLPKLTLVAVAEEQTGASTPAGASSRVVWFFPGIPSPNLDSLLSFFFFFIVTTVLHIHVGLIIDWSFPKSIIVRRIDCWFPLTWFTWIAYMRWWFCTFDVNWGGWCRCCPLFFSLVQKCHKILLTNTLCLMAKYLARSPTGSRSFIFLLLCIFLIFSLYKPLEDTVCVTSVLRK